MSISEEIPRLMRLFPWEVSIYTIIISTANERIQRLTIDPLRDGVYYVVVHQEFFGGSSSIPERLCCNDVDYIKLSYPGLSKSRNIGISKVKTKYAYVTDDDVAFDCERVEAVVKWMQQNDIDVATCCFRYGDGSYPKNYKDKPFKHNFLSAAKVSSIEIFLNIDKLREYGISFDEGFGLGTSLPSGEEYIFVTDCIAAGLNVWYYPMEIGVHPAVTSGNDYYSSTNKILAKREMFKRIFGWKCFVFILAFWIKKLPKTPVRYVWPFTKGMLLGLR